MCGPLTMGFALTQSHHPLTWQQQLRFHGLLNLGRMLSYTLVGASIGAIGSVLMASGQWAGIGSPLRRWVSVFMGILLIGLGLVQIWPQFPRLPLLHPLVVAKLHERLGQTMQQLALQPRWWTPLLLGMVWGLIPCGFLYIAQLKAAATGTVWMGGATMFAFGLGTLPTLLGVGLSTVWLSQNRRAQLFRMGGWVTLSMGALMLFRTGEMVDYAGYMALCCLMLALIARPLHTLWPPLLQYRRLLGVGTFILSLVHVAHTVDHTFGWQLQAVGFMPLHQEVGTWFGAASVLLLLPLALTSTNHLQRYLGKRWRQLHLLSIPALLLGTAHVVLTGSNYLGAWIRTPSHQGRSAILMALVIGILLLRIRSVWSIFSLEQAYASPQDLPLSNTKPDESSITTHAASSHDQG
jgi:uncharacterized protein